MEEAGDYSEQILGSAVLRQGKLVMPSYLLKDRLNFPVLNMGEMGKKLLELHIIQ